MPIRHRRNDPVSLAAGAVANRCAAQRVSMRCTRHDTAGDSSKRMTEPKLQMHGDGSSKGVWRAVTPGKLSPYFPAASSHGRDRPMRAQGRPGADLRLAPAAEAWRGMVAAGSTPARRCAGALSDLLPCLAAGFCAAFAAQPPRAPIRAVGAEQWVAMREILFFVLSSFWAGAAHAATPGHGKTIAAAYIVGARGRPIDAVILGVFVTLSHTSGIILVGVLASLGFGWLRPQRIEAYLGLGVGLLVMLLGLWMLWTQRELLALAMGAPAAEPGHDHGHVHAPGHAPGHAHQHTHQHQIGGEETWHSHGWGTGHAHRLDLVTANRPKLPVLLALGVAGGLLPDPAALALLLAALASGKVLLGLTTVVVFSLGFATTLVVVGIIAAKIGERILQWLDSIWMVRLQILTTLFILGMGVVLTLRAVYDVALLSP